MASTTTTRGPSRSASGIGTWAGRLGIRLAVPAIVILIWQLSGDDSARINMPTFTRTLSSFGKLWSSGELLRALGDSNRALLWGYLIALGIALPLGFVMGSSRIAASVFTPYLTIALILPLIAVIPLLQAVFGIGLSTRSVVVTLFAFPFIAINTELGVRSVPADISEMARSFGLSRWKRLRSVVLPHAFPYLMTGARLGLGRAVVGMVIAELYLVSSGIGSLLTFYSHRFDAGAVFAIAMSMVLEGVIVMTLARGVERLVTRKR